MLDGAVKHSKYPLEYHITPLEGLLNDPNGLIQFKGKYHVFYQWNPFGTEHENKTWGHVVSNNMVDWKRRDIALAPSEYYDKDGIYSGSAVVKDDILYLFYTGNVTEGDGSKTSYQCYAISKDGETFEKKGPLFEQLEGYTRHVRDPKVWFDEKDDTWYLIIGAQTEDLKGTALLYASKDLIDWESKGELLTPEEIAKFEERGYMWECPDLFEMDDRWVFLLSPQGLTTKGHQFQNIYHSVYVQLKKEANGFVVSDEEMKELDWGFEFYAPQTFLADDGRRILYGWMGVMEPEQEKQLPTVQEGWVHALTIPRELAFEEGVLKQTPIAELSDLRKEKETYSLSQGWQYPSEKSAAEVMLAFSNDAQSFELKIKETTTLTFNASKKEFILSRKDWVEGAQQTRTTYLAESLENLRLFIDGSSVEVFINDGKYVATARYFEEEPLTVSYKGTNDGLAHVYSLK